MFVLSSDVVRVSIDLSIKFIMPSHCGESDFWRVPDSSLLVKEVVPSGSMSSNDSTFTIKKSDVFYKFAFSSGDKPMDFGLEAIGRGVARLILSNNSDLRVSFVSVCM
ncbi:hypothetical protein F2Q70_00002427 [Brassica cretica]|uniref:Uncharacterized protein n=1 Tax=Brassica cretica TaxID=69181 RepID=A0A8S9IWX7_BRACR|nr:hypothetical protein F2Q70_00002427 [Brassica cretica]KAF3565466.1 hypothetical protein DY000_02013862 [Brassica cretica]